MAEPNLIGERICGIIDQEPQIAVEQAAASASATATTLDAATASAAAAAAATTLDAATATAKHEREPIRVRLGFMAYPSITRPRDDDIQRIKDYGDDEGMWCATEKIHGANFSFITDGTDVNVAKRTSTIPIDCSFMHSEVIVAKYKSAALCAYGYVKHMMATKEFTTMYIYGELFGGGYPHKDVKGRMNPIQKGVYYCPHYEFYAYDIGFDDGTFLSYNDAIRVFEDCGFFYAKVLQIGCMEDLLKFNPHFVTTIPPMFSLPEIPDNTAEGVVIKRVEGSRPTFKIKDFKFQEISHKPTKREPVPDEAPGDSLNYVNDNRLSNVLSKDPLDGTNPAVAKKLAYLLARDAALEWYEDNGSSLQMMKINDLTKLLMAAAIEVVRMRFSQ